MNLFLIYGKKTGRKLSVLARLSNYVSFGKGKILLKVAATGIQKVVK